VHERKENNTKPKTRHGSNATTEEVRRVTDDVQLPRHLEGWRGCRKVGSRWRGLANEKSPPNTVSCRHRPNRDRIPLSLGYSRPPMIQVQPSSGVGLLPPFHPMAAPFCNESSLAVDDLQKIGAAAKSQFPSRF
jgi:hypothetical protein